MATGAKVKTLGVTSPATGGATKAPVIATASDPANLSKTILLVILGISSLLILASIVPLYEFVPYRVALAWHDRRVGIGILGGSLLVLALVFYVLLQT